MISESILTSEKVRLRPVQESDLPRFAAWLGDAEVRRWLEGIPSAPTLADEYDWYENKRADADNVLWSIESPDGELMGTVELRLTPRAQRAELGIAIQDKSRWGKGYGTATIGLVLEYAFRELRLNRVGLTTDEENGRAIRCYEKCGFAREGLMREHRLLGRRFGNTVIMGILRREWEER